MNGRAPAYPGSSFPDAEPEGPRPTPRPKPRTNQKPNGRHVNGHAKADGAPGFAPAFISAIDLDAKQLPALTWVIQDVLPVGLAIIAGKSKIGKSWLVLNAALAVADGMMLFDKLATFRHQVLYLALEDGERRLQSRMRKILGVAGPPDGLIFCTDWPKLLDGGLAALESHIVHNPETKLIILDTLGKLRGGGETRDGSGYQLDYDDMAPLHSLATRHDVCILIVHHTRKQDASDVFDLVSGTTGIVGACDTIMVLTKKRGEDIGQLAVTGRDIIEDGEFAIRFDKASGRWMWLGKASEFRDANESQKVFALLSANGGDMTVADIADELEISRNTIKSALTRMKRDMRVDNPERGKWRAFGAGKERA